MHFFIYARFSEKSTRIPKRKKYSEEKRNRRRKNHNSSLITDFALEYFLPAKKPLFEVYTGLSPVTDTKAIPLAKFFPAANVSLSFKHAVEILGRIFDRMARFYAGKSNVIRAAVISWDTFGRRGFPKRMNRGWGAETSR